MKRMLIGCFEVLIVSLLFSCEEGEAGKGTLTVEIWGEEFIEQGIPAEEFSDGWSVKFDKFLVNVGQITVAKDEGEPEISEHTFKIFDLVRQGPTQITIGEVTQGSYNNTSYRISPADDSTEIGNASIDDLELMKTGGYSVYIEGTATNSSEETKTFRWGFTTETHYHDCQSTAVVKKEAAAVVQITIHGDHLFFDDLFSSTPNLTFETLAEADSDEDGEVTSSELADYDITTLPNYQVGSTGIDNLWDFISYLTKTIGHIDGEGHCHTN